MFFQNIFAFDVRSSVSAGIKFDSNIRYQYLYDIIKTGKNDQRKSFFITNDADLSLMFGKDESFMLSYALFSDLPLQYPQYAKLRQSLEFAWETFYAKRWYFNIAATFHYADENYFSIHNLYFDAAGAFDMNYMINDKVTVYAMLKSGYYKGLYAGRLDYLDGPGSDAEAGFMYYPELKESMIKAGVGTGLYYFRDEVFNRAAPLTPLGVSNKYQDGYFTAEGKLSWKRALFFLGFRYAYMRWLNEDNMVDHTKRRADHSFTVSPAVSIVLGKYFRLKLYYTFNANISNIGEDGWDYTDYNYFQHIAGTAITFSF